MIRYLLIVPFLSLLVSAAPTCRPKTSAVSKVPSPLPTSNTALPNSSNTTTPISSSYSSTAFSAITALTPFYTPPSLNWKSITWWIAGTVYNDIMDHYTRSTQFQTPYGAALLKIAEDDSARSGVGATSDFWDDQLWWCLAWLRAYENYGEGYKGAMEQAREQWVAIGKYQISSTPAGFADGKTCNLDGAVWWNKQKQEVNAITTSLFAQVGARLMELDKSGSVDYKTPTLRALSWVRKEMLGGPEKEGGKENGIINVDHITPGTGCDKGRGTLTYNTGVYIGALSALYRVTGEKQYIDWATTSVTTATSGFYGEDNKSLVVHEGADLTENGNLVQWRDILFRNLVDYYETYGHSDAGVSSKIKAFFKANYEQIQGKARFGELYAANWFGKMREGGDWGTGSVLSILIGAMMML